MKRTTTIAIVRIVEEDSFPTATSARDTTIDTTAEELESWARLRCPTDMLPPAMQALSARLARWEVEGR